MDKQSEVVVIHSTAVPDLRSPTEIGTIGDEKLQTTCTTRSTTTDKPPRSQGSVTTRGRRLYELWVEEILWCIVSLLFFIGKSVADPLMVTWREADGDRSHHRGFASIRRKATPLAAHEHHFEHISCFLYHPH